MRVSLKRGARALFAEEFKRCDVHETVLKINYEIVMERECSDHVRFGLWEKPPEF
jgi:hypothetical protein